jgi:hypothetical protein
MNSLDEDNFNTDYDFVYLEKDYIEEQSWCFYMHPNPDPMDGKDQVPRLTRQTEQAAVNSKRNSSKPVYWSVDLLCIMQSTFLPAVAEMIEEYMGQSISWPKKSIETFYDSVDILWTDSRDRSFEVDTGREPTDPSIHSWEFPRLPHHPTTYPKMVGNAKRRLDDSSAPKSDPNIVAGKKRRFTYQDIAATARFAYASGLRHAGSHVVPNAARLEGNRQHQIGKSIGLSAGRAIEDQRQLTNVHPLVFEDGYDSGHKYGRYDFLTEVLRCVKDGSSLVDDNGVLPVADLAFLNGYLFRR